MEFFTQLGDFIYYIFNFIIHIDAHLYALVETYQWQTYLILFAIIFWETGVVIWPFLPGDSLLFAAGAIAALPASPLHPGLLILLLSVAAILGDTANYWIGHFIGPKAFKEENRFLKKKYLNRTHEFYERYGARTIIIARFVPVVRTFAPFVAGMGAMNYRRFFTFNVVGGIIWNALFISAGYLFGNSEFVKNNFSLVILAIIVLSCLPVAVEFIKAKNRQKKTGGATKEK